jgi:ankyrin repeat protein
VSFNAPKKIQYVAELRSYATHDPVVVRYLLDQGANPNLGPAIGDGIGESSAFRLVSDSGAILQSAAMHGNIESFDLLLAHGAVLSNAATMHAAAGEEKIEMMAHLLKLGVDVDQRDTYRTMGFPCYDSPLLRAMDLGKPRAVRFLLDHGASTLRKLPGPIGTGMTAMDLAERGQIVDEIRKMVKEVGER